MKKVILALSMSAAMASASTLGFGVEADYYNPEIEGDFSFTHNGTATSTDFGSDDDTATQIGVFLEHPIPIIPNIRLDYTSETSFEGTSLILPGTNTVEFTQLDTTLYYEVFDNNAFELDIGITGKWFDGSVSGTENQNFDLIVPMGYAATSIHLPVLPLRLDGDVKYVSYSGNNLSDIKVKAVWEVIAGLEAVVGYRYSKLKIDDEEDVIADMKIKGPFVGIGYRF